MLSASKREHGTLLFLRARDTRSEEALDRLERWVGDDPDRQALIEGLHRVWGGLGELREQQPHTITAANDDTVEEDWSSNSARRRVWAVAASFVLMALVGAAMLLMSPGQAPEWQVMATGIGERRDVTLADGTIVTLDAASEMRVQYRPDERLVQLVAGQAFFDVAHDASRPFHVEAGPYDVEALGTEFNVIVGRASSSVSLVEGSVQVSDLHEQRELFGLRREKVRLPIITLEPGQVFEYDQRTNARVRSFDSAAVSAWREGRIVFEDLPLPEAVSIINRHSQRAVVLQPGMPIMRVTGVFNAGDGMAFAQTVTDYLPNTRVTASSDQILLERVE